MLNQVQHDTGRDFRYNTLMILLVDFGSQTAHLIARRIRHLGAKIEIIEPEEALAAIEEHKPKGIILSGGPASVYEKGSPQIDPKIFELGIPILAICYGFQLAAYLLGGKVVGGKREYGPADLTLDIGNLPSPRAQAEGKFDIVKGLPERSTVWMSHGDVIEAVPQGFVVIGKTEHVPFALAEDAKRKIIGMLFHPEVEHTENGDQYLQNFIAMCGVKTEKKEIDVKAIEEGIKKRVGEESYVIGAISGGVDSTVAGILTAQVIGERFVPIFVDNGLMREDSWEHVKRIFTKYGHLKPIVVRVEKEMLQKLSGISDPEEKRKIIGKFYIEVFEREMEKLVASGKPVKFLMQGTIYSDVIESKGTKHSDKIKSHHNVGGLPEKMMLKLLEPVREFYKDEVRQIGKLLGLPDEFIWKQKFPGPGFAIRIRGEVTAKRLAHERQADTIVLEEIKKAGWLPKVFHSFPVMTGADSVAVKGDGRFFGEVVALRVTVSSDEMTSTWAQLPYDVLQRISSRIVNEVPGISRVVYDISTKPPATMEWE